MVPSVTEIVALNALYQFLTSVLPAGVPVVLGQVNRTPEPASADFVVQTATIRGRIETNVDVFQDCVYTGSIAGGTLTVTSVLLGTIGSNVPVYGTGVQPSTTVTGTLSGTGGTGTYSVSPSQLAASQQLASGSIAVLTPIRLTVQLDVHGPNGGDNAHLIQALLRDEYACTAFAGYGVDVTPLYAEDPKRVPFINAEKQWEERWVVDAVLQVNPVTTVGQQSAAQLQVTPRSAATFRP